MDRVGLLWIEEGVFFQGRERWKKDLQLVVALAVRSDVPIGAHEETAAAAGRVLAVVLAFELGVGEACFDGRWDAEGLGFFGLVLAIWPGSFSRC